jgi:hypothetical protein
VMDTPGIDQVTLAGSSTIVWFNNIIGFLEISINIRLGRTFGTPVYFCLNDLNTSYFC